MLVQVCHVTIGDSDIRHGSKIAIPCHAAGILKLSSTCGSGNHHCSDLHAILLAEHAINDGRAVCEPTASSSCQRKVTHLQDECSAAGGRGVLIEVRQHVARVLDVDPVEGRDGLGSLRVKGAADGCDPGLVHAPAVGMLLVHLVMHLPARRLCRMGGPGVVCANAPACVSQPQQ